jgi:hypothetical protein
MFLNDKLDINTDDIFDRLIDLKEYWVSRGKLPFYTFGPSAYMDGNTPIYHEGIVKSNPVLLENFGDLYSKSMAYLNHILGEEVALDDKLAYPAFHIIGADPMFLVSNGSWHQDRPHVTMGLGEEDYGTFTVAIKIPTGGAGLDYQDEEGQKYFPYEERMIMVHSGMVPHRIASFKEYVPGEYRITMQGHIIRKDGRLIIYW